MLSCNYISASQIITSQIPTPDELELIELVVNHQMSLGNDTLSFADIVDKLRIEFSPILKTRSEQIEVDLGALSAKLREVNAAKVLLDREIYELRETLEQMSDKLFANGISPYDDPEFKKNHMRLEPLYNKQNALGGMIEKIVGILNSGQNKLNDETYVLGEFIPSTTPSVVIYYNNLKPEYNRCNRLIGTFVHEMFHAWFYFMSNKRQRSVLAVDEPMVEFGALFFLQNLSDEMSKVSHKLEHKIKSILEDRVRTVRGKQYFTGNVAAYGYGCYLYEDLGQESRLWIDAYSRRSADILLGDLDVQDFQKALIPCYPFQGESKLKKLLKRIIFGGTKKTSAASIASSRTMVTYPITKSDPICKWRNASVATVIELVSLLPKAKMSREDFRDHMRYTYGGAFFRTPYQLALQLGLYYEDNGEYIPRFDHDITATEATDYMIKWMERYYVPNPYTKRGFVNVVPSVNLLYGLVDYVENHPTKANLATAGAALFGGEMGNIGCVKYLLNEYSKIIEVDANNEITLLVHTSGPIDVWNARDDKKAFFDHFN